ILEEDTFLKRPVFIIDDEIFIGNSKSVIDSLKQKLNA
ncbi:MAG: arsenate reductase, partial [Bacteroidota bacterium]|nr:arsenate reductase [Bacteroidota bacterium]